MCSDNAAHVRRAAVTDFDSISVENFVQDVVFVEMFVQEL